MKELCQLFLQSCVYIQCSNCCCFYKTPNQTQTTNILPTIEWEQTTPFVPPIHQGQVIKVYDGDTITIAAKLPYSDSPLYRFSVRLLGIDSPEIKGKTQEEKDAAQLSRKELESLILNKMVYLKDNAQEKYGRLLANVYVDNPTPENPQNQIHLNEWMLYNGFAVPYDGKTKKPYKPYNPSNI